MTQIGDEVVITVDLDDTRRGRRNDGEHCPFALAAVRILHERVDVTPPIMVTWTGNNVLSLFTTERQWELSDDLISEIEQFDAGDGFSPGTYTITRTR